METKLFGWKIFFKNTLQARVMQSSPRESLFYNVLKILSSCSGVEAKYTSPGWMFYLHGQEIALRNNKLLFFDKMAGKIISIASKTLQNKLLKSYA